MEILRLFSGQVGATRKETEEMTLPEKIELIHRSSSRMMELLKQPKDKHWWWFLQRETWVHLKRTIELAWMVFRKKE